jgi:tRNA A37 threonylcarbamoyladenosine dehydratase
MSLKLISRNPDLKKLLDDGYEIEISKGHLLIHSVPYVNSRKEIMRGVLITPIGDLAGDKILKPHDHTFYFAGEMPCYSDGRPISGILNSSNKTGLAEGIIADHYFSAKSSTGDYKTYHEKVTTYVGIISSQAASLSNGVSARTYKVIATVDEDDVFHYWDSNSSRSEILAVSNKMKGLKVAIIGLGGTGSYVLDHVSKTCVNEIHLYDNDYFLTHNAFRAPGAPSLETLQATPKKVNYLYSIYSQMHKNIIPHDCDIKADNINELSGMSFVFICIDDGDSKKIALQWLINAKVSFIDVGIGVEMVDDCLTGGIRTTTITDDKNDHIEKRISLSNKADEVYSSNIQISELNALNASLAVIKWKKLFGFYHDLECEHHSVYSIISNTIINDEIT